MRNDDHSTASDFQARVDCKAVMQHVAEGTPIEPELARRVRERAEQISDEIRREHGDIDVVKLLHDAREDI